MEKRRCIRRMRQSLLGILSIGISFSLLPAQGPQIDPSIDDSLRAVRFSIPIKGALPVSRDFLVDFQHNHSRAITVAKGDSAVAEVVAGLPEGVFPGPNIVDIRFKGRSLWKDTLYIPNPQPNPDEQPLISKVEPQGGFVGRAITLIGKNFGDNLDRIYIWLGDAHGHPYDADFNPVPASYLSSPDAQGNQEIRFYYPDIPQDLLHGDERSPKFWLSRQHRMWVFVNGQPSANAKTINLVNSNYQALIFFLTVGIFLVIGTGFWLLFRMRSGGQRQPWYAMVLDGSNHFSLPKIQVLGWTLLLAFGYTYYALMRWLVMDDGSIPDFPSSLLVLLGVTSGGALISMSQNNSDATRQWTDTPKLQDLIYEGAQLSLSKLQLILFTIIAMTLYITYLADAQLVFLGMPEVPTNLLLLMGISQGGAIAGKAVEATESNNLRQANPSLSSVEQASAQQPVVTADVPAQPIDQSNAAPQPQNPITTQQVPPPVAPVAPAVPAVPAVPQPPIVPAVPADTQSPPPAVPADTRQSPQQTPPSRQSPQPSQKTPNPHHQPSQQTPPSRQSPQPSQKTPNPHHQQTIPPQSIPQHLEKRKPPDRVGENRNSY